MRFATSAMAEQTCVAHNVIIVIKPRETYNIIATPYGEGLGLPMNAEPPP
jgi:hypothetical protein